MALQPETAMHLAVMEAIAMSRARVPALKLVFHVPNGGWRGRVEARLFKGMGVRAGVHDLILPAPAAGRSGMSLELKAPGKVPSKDQVDWAHQQRDVGWLCCWTDCPAAACQALIWYAEEVDFPGYRCTGRNALPKSSDIYSIRNLRSFQWPSQ